MCSRECSPEAYLFVLSPGAWRDPDPPDLREMAARAPEAFGPPVAALVVRPANGNFDVVVVQSSGTDMIADSARLLTGRPVYTVYVDVGTPRSGSFSIASPANGRASRRPPMWSGFPTPRPCRLLTPFSCTGPSLRSILAPGWPGARLR